MDPYEIFKKITAGAKFDYDRFRKDAEQLKLLRPKQQTSSTEVVESKPVPRSSKRGDDVGRIRGEHKIHVSGTDIPRPVEHFEALSNTADSRLLNAIREVFHFNQPTPIQMQAVPVMMASREIMACAPTGSGKTVAFLLPVLNHIISAKKEDKNSSERGIRALILSPTRELAKQTYLEGLRLSEGTGVNVTYLSKVTTSAAWAKKMAKKVDCLVTTPNRLIFLLSHDPPLISLSHVRWLVVDECDRLFEADSSFEKGDKSHGNRPMKSFRDQLGIIFGACDSKKLKRALFSATFSTEVEEWCRLNLDNVVEVYIGSKNTAAEAVKQELIFTGDEYGKLIALRDIIHSAFEPPMLIFVQSKERAKELFAELVYDGINVEAIHSDRTQLQRDNIVQAFREGKIWVLICTELMGRGIDFKGVRCVVNYDLPTSPIAYIHRVGRTGRMGRAGHAVSFFTRTDAPFIRTIAAVLTESGCEVPEFFLKLPKDAELDFSGKPKAKGKKRPNKKSSRKSKAKRLNGAVPQRETIRTVPQPDLEKIHKKKKFLKKARFEHKRRRLNDTTVDSATS